jgi:hypothetical protein
VVQGDTKTVVRLAQGRPQLLCSSWQQLRRARQVLRGAPHCDAGEKHASINLFGQGTLLWQYHTALLGC